MSTALYTRQSVSVHIYTKKRTSHCIQYRLHINMKVRQYTHSTKICVQTVGYTYSITIRTNNKKIHKRSYQCTLNYTQKAYQIIHLASRTVQYLWVGRPATQSTNHLSPQRSHTDWGVTHESRSLRRTPPPSSGHYPFPLPRGLLWPRTFPQESALPGSPLGQGTQMLIPGNTHTSVAPTPAATPSRRVDRDPLMRTVPKWTIICFRWWDQVWFAWFVWFNYAARLNLLRWDLLLINKPTRN